MSIHDPEIPSLFGALDSLSCEDGGPLSAHLLRTIALNANRMTSRGHLMLSLAWPMSGNQNRIPSSGLIAESGDWRFGGRIGDATAYVGSGAVSYRWIRSVGPVHVKKKPGLRMGTAKITASIGGTDKVYFKVCTVATGSSGATVEATGDGSGDPQTFTLSDIPMDPGPDEEIALWVRGSSLTLPPLGDQATYGYPNTGGIDNPSTLADRFFWPWQTGVGFVVESSGAHTTSNPIWNTTGDTYASDPHTIWFYDRFDGLLNPPELITGVGPFGVSSSGVCLYFDGRNLDPSMQAAVIDGGKFEIREMTAAAGFELFGFAVAADGRTT